MSGKFLSRGLDFGLATDNEKEMRAFYEDLGLSHLKTDHLAEGQDEVYYTLHGSWLKFVTSDQPMAPGVSGYKELIIVDTNAEKPRSVVDPDGTPVTVAPRGYRGVEEVGVVMEVNDIPAQERMLVEGAHAERSGDGYRVGNTMFFLQQAEQPLHPGPMFTRGFTMVTFPVEDIASAHAGLVAAGGGHGLRICADPIVPGRCLFSFVSDPNGNWIELAQFSEFTGPLPDPVSEAPTFDVFLGFRDRGVPDTVSP